MRVMPPPWVPKDGAFRAVALEVLINGPISRSDIARRLDLSQGSLTRLSTPLLQSGLLVEAEQASPGRSGRRSRPLDVVSSSRHFVGVKLTGTEVLGVVTDLRAKIVDFARMPLASTEPELVCTQVAELVTHLAESVPDVTALGVGLGGLVDNYTVVTRAPFLRWSDVPLGPMLSARTGLPTVIENDIVALTESEHWFGSGRGLDRFAVITIGAGVGYGAVISGTAVVGPDSGIGLVGHWPLDANGPLCPQGHRGCAAAVLTMPGITKSISAVLDRQVDYEECLDLADAGDPAARRVVDDAGRGLGRLIAAVANLTVPDRVILGGEGVRLADVAAQAVRGGITADRDPLASDVELVVNHTDEKQWCRGRPSSRSRPTFSVRTMPRAPMPSTPRRQH